MKQRHLALLTNLLRHQLAGQKKALVAIDGASALGKSTLARTLARILGATVISTDSYATPNRTSQLAAVRGSED